MTVYLIIALLCYIAYRAVSGADNGLLYANDLPVTPPFYQKYGVHEIEFIQTTIVAVGFWAAGLDLFQIILGWFVASPFFKGFINIGTGRPFVDPAESADVDQDGRPGYRLFGIQFPAIGYGWGRVVLAVVALVGIYYWSEISLMFGLPFPFDMERAYELIAEVV